MTSITLNIDAQANATQSNVLGDYAVSFALSLGMTSLFNAFLVVLKETSEPVLNLMKATGHHWITHGMLDLAVFLALGLLLASQAPRWREHPALICTTAIGGSAAGALIIAGYYLGKVL